MRRLADIHRYTPDLLAGLTVALVGLPQCLAYAMMSGLPPEYGLATAAVPGFLAALFGRSAVVVTGPTNTTGLLVLAALAPYLGSSGLLEREGLPVLAALTLLVGLARILLQRSGSLRILRAVPDGVLVGFTAGAGILIGVMQLDEALGLAPITAATLWDEVFGIGQILEQTHALTWPAVTVALGTFASLLAARRFFPRAPFALLIVVVAAASAWLFDLHGGVGLPLVAERAQVPTGWPEGALPLVSLDVWLGLAGPAMAIALMGTFELMVSLRANDEMGALEGEVRAQGLANLAGAFASAFPASASLTRSALLRFGGARTRLAPAAAALVTVPLVLYAGPAISYLPQASLAGVLLATAVSMIRSANLAAAWRSRRLTRIVLSVTLLATLTLPLQWAVLAAAGFGLSLRLVARAYFHPQPAHHADEVRHAAR